MTSTTAALAIASTTLEAAISPMGAELVGLRRPGRDLLWQGDPRVWAGISPILFPVVGKVRDDRVLVDGRAYSMPQHGFARRRVFEVVEAEPSRCRLRLTDDEETRAVYPFAFELELAYALTDDALAMSARVTNAGTRPLPAAFGFHPGFRWPLDPARTKRDYALWIDAEGPLRVARLDGDGLIEDPAAPLPLEDGRLDLDEDLFARGALVLLGAHARRIVFGPRDGGGLHIALTPRNLPDLAVWMRPGGDFLCIEPWHGHADPASFRGELLDKPGSFRLAPATCMRFDVAINVEERPYPPR